MWASVARIRAEPVLLRPGQCPLVGTPPLRRTPTASAPRGTFPHVGPLPGNRELLLVIVEGRDGVADKRPSASHSRYTRRAGVPVRARASPSFAIRSRPMYGFSGGAGARSCSSGENDVVRGRHHAGQGLPRASRRNGSRNGFTSAMASPFLQEIDDVAKRRTLRKKDRAVVDHPHHGGSGGGAGAPPQDPIDAPVNSRTISSAGHPRPGSPTGWPTCR